MNKIHNIQYKMGSKEELLPGFEPAFPYIASTYSGSYVPWHWHKEVELFYIENGELEYCTPAGKSGFQAGSGGFVNSNILHMTKSADGAGQVSQLEHIFDTSLIGGQQGSLIEQKYITPLTTASQIEIIGLHPENLEHKEILGKIRLSFLLSDEDYAYEIKLRSLLSEIWCQLLIVSEPLLRIKGGPNKTNDKIKLMLVYLHEHYAEKITIAQMAAAAYISERECFRVFHDNLHMSPTEYLKNYRLQEACLLLAESNAPITDIGHSCGLGSSSYFGRLFHDSIGCTPLAYRTKWRNPNRIGQK